MKKPTILGLVLGLALSGALAGQAGVAGTGRLVYIGTYTGAASRGIYAFRFSETSGALTPVGLVAETQNPTFLVSSADGRFLFAVNEISTYDNERAGSVSSFAVDAATGKLTPRSVQSSKGADPCHLALDRTGRFLAVANYTGGTFAVFPVADGRLSPASAVLTNLGSGPDRSRQMGPHAHAVVFDPSNRFLLGADLGSDRVWVYRFDPASGRVTPNSPASAASAPGAGPRHLAFHPDGARVFAINELASTIETFTWTASSGALAPRAVVTTLPAGYRESSATAEIAVHPNGRFVYGSNRGHDSVAVFAAGAGGELSLVEIESTRGRTPRNFTIDPTGRWLLAGNQDSGTIAVFAIDGKTGALAPVAPLAVVGSPVSIVFVP